MMQVPNFHNPYMQMPVQPPVAQPNYNAVKIDIINPQAGAPVAPQYPMAQPQYAQPTMPYYNYPQTPVYDYPQATHQPYYMPPQATKTPVEQPKAPVCPPCEVPVQPAPPVAAPAQPVQATATVAAPQPQVIQQQNINAVPTAVPEPAVTKAPPVEAVAPTAPAATTAPVEVVEPAPVTPQVDLNGFIAKLTSPDYEVQANAMEEIANMVKDEPQKATELLDEKVVTALNNIITADSSKLEGPTSEQIAARQKLMSGQKLTDEENKLANTMTPMEQAERNKSYAMFTESIMQKLYGDEVKKLANTTVPLTELPGAVTIVDQLKDNPNPMVRASAIEALSYIQQPAYKEDLKTLFTIAQKDQDKNVQEAANAALDKLSKI